MQYTSIFYDCQNDHLQTNICDIFLCCAEQRLLIEHPPEKAEEFKTHIGVNHWVPKVKPTLLKASRIRSSIPKVANPQICSMRNSESTDFCMLKYDLYTMPMM